MSLMTALKGAFTSGVKELNKEYGKTDNFLNAVCASCALIAFADGTCEESEKKKAIEVLTGHTQLSSIYQRAQIEGALNSALSHAQTASGKQELARQLDSVLSLPNGTQMAEDVYLVALDVASSNSNHKVGEDEQRVLDKLANRLHVDPSKFEF
ncbi:MAG: terB [Bradyrhizobium sp.]|nr:terB [Bradyrhizobium sp.]